MPCEYVKLKDGSTVRFQYRAGRGRKITERDRAEIAAFAEDLVAAAERAGITPRTPSPPTWGLDERFVKLRRK